MTFSGNTVPYKTEWIKAYQETHYKQPVFPIFADQRFADVLAVGSTVAWSYDSDSDVFELGLDGGYSVDGKTVTDETLTVNQLPSSAFRIPGPQRIQDHRPTQAKWATKAMNRIFWKIDAKILGQLQANAGSVIDASQFGGVAGVPITATVANTPAIFTAARRTLKNQNVIYDENKKWSGYTKLDSVAKYPACAIPAELEEQLLLAIGFKPGDVGDGVLVKGFINMLFGFNTFTSTALPFTGTFTLSGTPSNADTIVIGGTAGITLNLVTSIGTTAGNVLISGSTNTATNIFSALNAPYVSFDATKFISFTRASLTLPQRFILDLISATNPSNGVVGVTVLGQGTVAVSTTSANGAWSNLAVHAIFGTSQSIGMILQKYPELVVSGDIIGNGNNGGYIAKDFVTWTLAGWKVFKSMIPQLIDVPIACSTFVSPNNTYN